MEKKVYSLTSKETIEEQEMFQHQLREDINFQIIEISSDDILRFNFSEDIILEDNEKSPDGTKIEQLKIDLSYLMCYIKDSTYPDIDGWKLYEDKSIARKLYELDLIYFVANNVSEFSQLSESEKLSLFNSYEHGECNKGMPDQLKNACSKIIELSQQQHSQLVQDFLSHFIKPIINNVKNLDANLEYFKEVMTLRNNSQEEPDSSKIDYARILKSSIICDQIIEKSKPISEQIENIIPFSSPRRNEVTKLDQSSKVSELG